MSIPQVAVIGGGIAGLTCAHRLLELESTHGRPVEILIFEAGPKLGGVIETEMREGFILEKGPDSFISEKPACLELCKRLGLESEIINTNFENRRSFVVRHQKLLPMPEGFYLIAPTRLKTFLETPIFSLSGKMRMLLETLVPKNKNGNDESVGQFIRRRFGKEALERVGQAMLAGIYTGSPEVLSLAATMPRFKEWEQKYGSVTKGLLAEAKKEKEVLGQASGPRYSLFLSFRNGMETLTQALTARIPEQSVKPNSPVKEVFQEAPDKKWKIVMASGQIRVADAVCLALPAAQSALLLKNGAKLLSDKLGGISYESVATLNLAYRREAVGHALEGFGFVVPRIEKSSLIACGFSSQKFIRRAPQGYVLLRVFVGGAFGRSFFEREDKDLLESALEDLNKFLNIKEAPVFSVLRRYPNSMAQYGVGHLNLVSEIKKQTEKHKGLFLAGAAFRGVGIPDCIADAELQAEQIYRTFFVEGGRLG